MEYSIQAGSVVPPKATEITATAGHPRYFNQLYSGLNETGMIAQMLPTPVCELCISKILYTHWGVINDIVIILGCATLLNLDY